MTIGKLHHMIHLRFYEEDRDGETWYVIAVDDKIVLQTTSAQLHARRRKAFLMKADPYGIRWPRFQDRRPGQQQASWNIRKLAE